MKQIYLVFFATILAFGAQAQSVATFDDLTLTPDNFWNGSDESGNFESGGITFYNTFEPDWNSWSGFCYSDMTDTITPGFDNQYSAITGTGYNGSANYAVCYPSPTAELKIDVPSKVSGFYITNSTYAYLSMKNGDVFAKKFGGESGNDPDFLKLLIEVLDADEKPIDTVYFYLADFRFVDHSKDYILNKWTWVDLSNLKEAGKLRFSLSSTDNSFGFMNTPGYFCMDNLNSEVTATVPGLKLIHPTVFPNPFTDRITVSGIHEKSKVTISDISGKLVAEYLNISNNQTITGLNNLIQGIYFVKTDDGKNVTTTKLIRK